MDMDMEKKSIKGIIGRLKNSRDKEKVWNLQKKKTKIKNGEGKRVTIPSNSYKIGEENGNERGYMYYEGAPKDAQLAVVAYYTDKAEKNTKERQGKEKNEKTQGEKQGKLSRIKIIPIVIILGASVLSLRGCSSEQTVVENKVTQIESTIYNTGNPSILAWGQEGQVAQEGKYVNEKVGQGAEGDFYNSNEVYQNEEEAVENVGEYEELKEELSTEIQGLEGKEATMEELSKIKENVEGIQEIYEDKSDMIDENVDNFNDNVDKYPDGHTDEEKETAQILKKEFYKNKDLVGENKKVAKDLVKMAEKGNVVIDDVSVERDGDITIKGEHIEKVVKAEKITGIRAAVKNIKGFFNGLLTEKTEER